jgi:putative membrane protein insertion efficiency factor
VSSAVSTTPGATSTPAASRAARLARAVVSAPILVYSRFISPALPRRCKYEPTCSRYAVEAIREYGILRGLMLAGWRLLRCNPWSHGGYDPVEAQRVFRTRSE